MPSKPSKATAEASRDVQNRATALHHARRIQDQKDLQNKVLDTIIEFVDLPSSPKADPAKPSAADSSQLKKGLSIFQQRDLDDLITERNISDKCGYVLCPRPVHKDADGPTNRILWGKKGGSELKVVPRVELERWCSTQCGNRAIFLKAQLNENPAWVSGALKEELVFLDEVEARKTQIATETAVVSPSDKQSKPEELVDGIRQLAIRDGLSAEDEETLRKLQELALERGKIFRGSKIEDVTLVEKKTKGPARPPERGEAGSSGTIDGYEPKFKTRLHGDDEDDDSDHQDILDI